MSVWEWWFPRQKRGIIVTVFCDGKHPYLSDDDARHINALYPSKVIQFRVEASDWNKAEKVALDKILQVGSDARRLAGEFWSIRVIAMENER